MPSCRDLQGCFAAAPPFFSYVPVQLVFKVCYLYPARGSSDIGPIRYRERIILRKHPDWKFFCDPPGSWAERVAIELYADDVDAYQVLYVQLVKDKPHISVSRAQFKTLIAGIMKRRRFKHWLH